MNTYLYSDTRDLFCNAAALIYENRINEADMKVKKCFSLPVDQETLGF